MGWGERVIAAIEARWERKRKNAAGPQGQFHRAGGNELLYDVPVTTGSLVIDAGGYQGEWTEKMIARYGCRSEIFEPFPTYAENIRQRFSRNALVHVHAAALGGRQRTTTFAFAADGTSEFKTPGKAVISTDVPVVDIADFLNQHGGEQMACLKLNIEGGEYEVLERLLETDTIRLCRSLLIQFHPQPEDYQQRHRKIEEQLQRTHIREWCYPMVWEKWVAIPVG